MSRTERKANGFPEPETVSRFGLAEGRPHDKRTKNAESYRRIFANLLIQDSASDGYDSAVAENEALHRILDNREQRAIQLAGGKPRITERQIAQRLKLLLRSNDRDKVSDLKIRLQSTDKH